MQSAVSGLLRIEPNAEREMEQERQSRKSGHQNLAEDRSPLPSVDEPVNQGPLKWKQLVRYFLQFLKVAQ
jgi:hypothetical protein